MNDETQRSSLIQYMGKKQYQSGTKYHLKKVFVKVLKQNIKFLMKSEFTRGREVLGEIIVHGMLASGGTDIDWLIEHKGKFHNFRIQRIP